MVPAAPIQHLLAAVHTRLLLLELLLELGQELELELGLALALALALTKKHDVPYVALSLLPRH